VRRGRNGNLLGFQVCVPDSIPRADKANSADPSSSSSAQHQWESTTARKVSTSAAAVGLRRLFARPVERGPVKIGKTWQRWAKVRDLEHGPIGGSGPPVQKMHNASKKCRSNRPPLNVRTLRFQTGNTERLICQPAIQRKESRLETGALRHGRAINRTPSHLLLVQLRLRWYLCGHAREGVDVCEPQ